MTDSVSTDPSLTQMISLKPVEDCSARENLMNIIFSGSTPDTQDLLDLKIQMADLETLLTKEMRIWWDLSTLKNYAEKKMIPRGLRIKKFPSIVYTEDFKQKWQDILTTCSLNLIQLIISHEESMLVDIRQKIITLQDSVKIHAEMELFNNLDGHMRENLNKLEKVITDIKHNKFMRDLQDYKTDCIYLWNKSTSTPRSILRNSRRRNVRTPGKVNFSSTEAESSDTSTDLPEEQAVHAPQATTQNPKRSTNHGKSAPSSSKNSAGVTGGEQDASTRQPRYPRRNNKKK